MSRAALSAPLAPNPHSPRAVEREPAAGGAHGDRSTRLAARSPAPRAPDALEGPAERRPSPTLARPRVAVSSSLFGRLAELVRDHARPVAAALMGATLLPIVAGTPAVAFAETRRRDDSAETTPPAPATAAPTTAAPTTAAPTPTLAPGLVLDPALAPHATPALAPRLTVAPTLAPHATPALDPFTLTTADGRRVSLVPTYGDLARWGLLDPAPAGPRALPPPPRETPTAPTSAAPAPRAFAPGPGADAALDELLGGVSGRARAEPWYADFDSYFRARAAVSEVPTALAGMALEPVAGLGYRVVDHIPAPIRRPFDRALGILLENAVSIPANLLTARVLGPTGQLPDHAALQLAPYPQIRNSCGETMVATWLKGQGVPIALGEVDTQMPFFEGSNLLEDAELRQRGFSLISGPGTLDDLRTYVAHGYPVMVSVGWPNGGGHYAVVTGYDERTRTLTIDGWNADGRVAQVPYDAFAANWGRHLNLMTVAHPQRDARLSELRSASRISREARVQDGLSISEIWVTQRLELFIEAAYRYRGTADDLTVRLNVNTAERAGGVGDMLGGSVRYEHRFDDGTRVHFYAEHLSTKGPADAVDVTALLRSSAAYVGVQHGGFGARAGWDRGAFQAAMQAELNRRLLHVGAEARVSVGLDGSYTVFFGATGTF